jgi:hypothetical protein
MRTEPHNVVAPAFEFNKLRRRASPEQCHCRRCPVNLNLRREFRKLRAKMPPSQCEWA